MEDLDNIIIGQDGIKVFLTNLVANKEAYPQSRIPFPHICLQIREGDGRTFLLKTLTRVIKKYNMRTFAALDDYLEYRIAGPVSNIIKVFSELDSRAVYTNGYEGVVGLDVSMLSNYMCDEEIKRILKEKITKLMETATAIFFVNPDIRNKTQLMRWLEELHVIHIEVGYSMCDYQKIMQRYMEEELRIEILSQERDEIALVLEKWLIEKNKVRRINVKEVLELAKELAFYIVKPQLDLTCLRNADIYCREENKEVLTNA